MKVTLSNGKTYRYSFKHFFRQPFSTPEGEVVNEVVDELKRTREFGLVGRVKAITYVYIEDVTTPRESWDDIPSGVAFCWIHDKFSKEEGRKIALTRALDMLFPSCGLEKIDGPNRIVRGEFWANYFTRGGQKSGS